MSGGGHLAAPETCFAGFCDVNSPVSEKNLERKQAAFTLAECATHVAHFDDIRQAAFTLVEGNTHVATSNNLRRAAFTLAEVLITLGIIGVVAALTMPSLIQKYKIQEYVSKLNKFYSVISNVYVRAKQDNGEISEWSLIDYQVSKKDENDILYYLLPYMNVLKFCGKTEAGCFPDLGYKSIGSQSFGLNLNERDSYSNAILNDGTYISSLTFGNSCGNEGDPCGYLRVDVNGSAPPNTLGIDLHTFVIYKDRIVPAGISGVLNSDYYLNRGDACTAHVIYEKNMNYIKDGKCRVYE